VLTVVYVAAVASNGGKSHYKRGKWQRKCISVPCDGCRKVWIFNAVHVQLSLRHSVSFANPTCLLSRVISTRQ